MSRKPPLERARTAARLGLPPHPKARFRLLRRIIVRLNWFTIRHQMDYNLAVLRAIEELRADLDAHREFVLAHQHRVAEVMASMEASLRSEILGTDRREDRLERDVVILQSMTAALSFRLDELSSIAASEARPSFTDDHPVSSDNEVHSTVARLRHAQSE